MHDEPRVGNGNDLIEKMILLIEPVKKMQILMSSDADGFLSPDAATELALKTLDCIRLYGCEKFGIIIIVQIFTCSHEAYGTNGAYIESVVKCGGTTICVDHGIDEFG